MTDHRLAPAALAAALLLGVAADALIRGTPWGINVLLGTLLFLGAAIPLLRRAGRADVTGIAFAAVPALLAAAGIAWRSSHFLVPLDVLLLVGFVSLLCLAPRGVRIATASDTAKDEIATIDVKLTAGK